MCGILGWINPSFSNVTDGREAVGAALKALQPRGPDGGRLEWGKGWLLGHTRLAILDLSDRASQPMTDGLGAWVVFNGEIYNFRELREELIASGFKFRSTGDAEVVLHALRCWGPGCLERLRGMFAFGWLDTERRTLILARDRYGVKPLAYELRDDSFAFASDLFALGRLPGATRDVDKEAAYLYMGLGYIPSPYTIFTGVRKVMPGHYLYVQWSEAGLRAEERPYWSIGQVPPANYDGSLLNGAGAIEEYEKRIAEAVKYRLISDVPVGVLLSGGIDSTLVTAICREQGSPEIPGFTMGFEDPGADELPFARAIARHLGIRHEEFQIREEDVLGTWWDLWSIYDEPFGDSSALPMVALCRSVASRVKVALSGDGGDEVFCGYPWHRALDRLNPSLHVPAILRRHLAVVGSSLLPSLRYKASVFGQTDRVAQWSVLRTGLVNKTSRLLPVEDAGKRPTFCQYFREWSRGLESIADPLDWGCRMDLLTYLPDDLMVKADRASMSVGLELREPLLDHELTAWCLKRPTVQRYDRCRRMGKVLPRNVLYRRVPRELIERPKQGFTPPLDRWLKGPLLPAVNDALARLERGELAPLCLPPGCRGWVDCAARLNDQHQQFLWRIVCFSEWMRHHGSVGN